MVEVCAVWLQHSASVSRGSRGSGEQGWGARCQQSSVIVSAVQFGEGESGMMRWWGRVPWWRRVPWENDERQDWYQALVEWDWGKGGLSVQWYILPPEVTW